MGWPRSRGGAPGEADGREGWTWELSLGVRERTAVLPQRGQKEGRKRHVCLYEKGRGAGAIQEPLR